MFGLFMLTSAEANAEGIDLDLSASEGKVTLARYQNFKSAIKEAQRATLSLV